ncbi:MAG: hypothetical protein ACD_41C00072G0003 [uncultured bacterium]|nr:MAG: hypothetical protein ACD_41C00072G0003 [uncultured bacterium]
MRKTLADTFAMVSFSIVVGMFMEVCITGLTLEQSLHCRLGSFPIKLVQGRPYGLYRDWIVQLCGDTHLKAGEVFAYTSFQTPIYALLLLAKGASVQQVLMCCGTRIVASLITGRLYVPFLAACHRLFNVHK